MSKMLEALLRLDPANSRILGEHLRAIADQLLGRAEAAHREDTADQRRREVARQAHQAARRALTMIERGQEPAAAVAAVAGELDPRQVQTWLAVEQRKAGQRRRLRNVKIMRLAGRGWTDDEIGRKFTMHRKSVNRIVRRMLRENPPTLLQHCDARLRAEPLSAAAGGRGE
jgi:hypothetical protein